MKRKLTQKLIDWKNRPNHKPLILQGARQVGKTYILEEFGRNHYKNYIKVKRLSPIWNPCTINASCPTKHWLSWMRFRIVKERSWL